MVGLFGSTVLEAAVGVASVYLILAMFCSTVNEWVAHALDARAQNLRRALASLFHGQLLTEGLDFLSAFYFHPVVRGQSRSGEHFSYLPSRAFSAAVIDLATSHMEGSVTFHDLETGISKLPPGPVRRVLLTLIQNAGGDLERAQANIENWFNDAMERASGWYRRRAQVWNLVLALLVTVATNADTLHLLQRFWSEPALRAASSGTLAGTLAAGTLGAATLRDLAPVLGWTPDMFRSSPLEWASRVAGWLLTIVAVSLGAPFWFDILNRTVNLRNAGRPPVVSVTGAQMPVSGVHK